MEVPLVPGTQPDLDDARCADPDFDDSGWDTIPVPSHWVLPGTSRAAAGIRPPDLHQCPVPVSDRPAACPGREPHRRPSAEFELPDWDVERVLLRFDGVESVYRVWLNGMEVGVGKGSRLVQEFDVTELVRPGRNVIIVRVHQWSSMSYLEDQDQWWLPGIFRDVTVLGRPTGAIDDLWLRDRVRGRRRRQHRSGDHRCRAAFPVRDQIPELGVTTTRSCRRQRLAPFPVGRSSRGVRSRHGSMRRPSLGTGETVSTATRLSARRDRPATS